MTTERKTRLLNTEARIIDEKRGIVEYVASDESIDSYSEIILATGWKFNRFAKNAPFVDSHDYYSIDKLLGKVVDFKVNGKKLEERVQWAIDCPDSKLAQLGWQLTLKGYLTAVSVGFIPTKMAWPSHPDWAAAVVAAALKPEDQGKVRAIYIEHEQIELSACIIGSNPNALAKAFTAKDISEEQLASIGFGGDAEFEFLQRAALAWEADATTDVMRSMIRLEMQRTYTARNFAKGKTPEPAKTSHVSADDVAAKQRSDREDFLKQLKALTPAI